MSRNAIKVAVKGSRDGRAPAVMASSVAHAVWEQWNAKGWGCRLIVYTADPQFTEHLYSDLPHGDIDIRYCPHGVKLEKDQNIAGVDQAGTARLLSRYPEQVRECVGSCLRWERLQDVHIALSVGAPELAFAASWAGVPVIGEILDHSWGETLQAMGLQGGTYEETAVALNLLRDHESHVDHVFLFSCLTPAPFIRRWRHVAGERITVLDGVIGRPACDPTEARRQLALDLTTPLIAFLGGGTGVWRVFERALFEVLQSSRDPLPFHVVLPHPTDNALAVFTRGTPHCLPRNQAFTWALAASDVHVARASGGAFMDAVHYRRPFCAIPEPWHPQVEALRQLLLRDQHAFTPKLDVFRGPPHTRDLAWARKAADELLAALAAIVQAKPEMLHQLAANMATIPYGQEVVIAEAICNRLLAHL